MLRETLKRSDTLRQIVRRLRHFKSNLRPNTGLIERAEITKSCRDCDYLPRHADAGQIVDGILTMHNGVKVADGGYHGDWMNDIISTLHGVHEPQEEKVFFEVLKSVRANATMIELGCFWAYYSLWFKLGHPERTSYLIEPNPEKLVIGKRNFALNNEIGDFTHGFIGREPGEGPFIDWDGKSYDIPEIQVDKFVQDNGIEFIDILHSDIQGAELDMLMGAEKTVKAGHVGYVFISTHYDRHEPCKNWLLEHGFKPIAEHTIAESFSGDGLLAYHGPNVAPISPIEISAAAKRA